MPADYKIEIYNGANLLHTVTSKPTNVPSGCDASELKYKDVLTTGIGTFSFALACSVAGRYSNVAVDDTARIWLSTTGSFSGDPQFRGTIYQIAGVGSGEEGHTRVFTGLGRGEILTRRLKHGKQWYDTHAHLIVDSIAASLGLGTGEIDPDAGMGALHETINVETETYFDLLSRISDYWVTAGAGDQVKKDFYVDVNNNLVWKGRPIRSLPDVESFTDGQYISYSVRRNLEEVKNNIRVIGQNTKRYPTVANDDALTDLVTDWSLDNGDHVTAETDRKVGSYSIKGLRHAGTGTNEIFFHRTIPECKISIGKDKYKRVNFWWKATALFSMPRVSLFCPDHDNYVCSYVNADTSTLPPNNTWQQVSIPFGLPSDFSFELGTPNYDDCHAIGFQQGSLLDLEMDLFVDQLYLDDCSYSGVASSGSADKDCEVTDQQLKSDAECTSRANALLYQKSTVPISVTLEVPGNMNVLIGDHLPVTIAEEALSATHFDVLTVEQSLTASTGHRTTFSGVNSSDTRVVSPRNAYEGIAARLNSYRIIAKGSQLIGIHP